MPPGLIFSALQKKLYSWSHPTSSKLKNEGKLYDNGKGLLFLPGTINATMNEDRVLVFQWNTARKPNFNQIRDSDNISSGILERRDALQSWVKHLNPVRCCIVNCSTINVYL